ncbi:isochorismatase family protein [Pseudoclavibacter sp. 8L]|uniref:isochorismatase family protein n=1 Tax=Pseudoclavibacter sp. 8L TaxID=2653162 RepID=UPI00135A1F57|nr:isochorismatase family protein [Pseudoclavibacter sp. 8L]
MTSPRRALVLVDVQLQYFSGPLEIHHPPHADSLPRITATIDAAEAAGIPIAAIQHSSGDQAPVFNPTMTEFALHPDVEARRRPEWKAITKRFSSVFAETDLLAWLRAADVDTVTFVGYMTNNCIIASAAAAEELGIDVEVLSDATGAINLANSAGFASAKTVHSTLMALLQSNLAAVAASGDWMAAVEAGHPLPKDDLPTSAVAGVGRSAHQAGQ